MKSDAYNEALIFLKYIIFILESSTDLYPYISTYKKCHQLYNYCKIELQHWKQLSLQITTINFILKIITYYNIH